MSEKSGEDLKGCLGLCLITLAWIGGIVTHMVWRWLVG